MKNLKQVHEKCTGILELIDSAQFIADYHSDQIKRLKSGFDSLDFSYKWQYGRLVINATIVERLKTYYLNQILKLTK